MRHLTTAAMAQGSESASSHREQLVLEIGTIVKLEDDPVRNAVRDEVGFSELRNMANQQ